MARVRSTGVNRAGLSYLGYLGTTLAEEEHRNQMMQESGGASLGVLLAGLGDATAPSITGIDSVDKIIYDVKGQLDEFKMAMTITTISSLAAAISGVLLILDKARK